MDSNRRVIAACALIAVGVGSANAMLKDKRMPTTRFLIGSGVAFLILSAMADMGEGMAEVAKGLAAGVASTVVLGDGGGLLSYINTGEVDTQKKQPKDSHGTVRDANKVTPVHPVQHPGGTFRPDNLAAFPGLTPTPPR